MKRENSLNGLIVVLSAPSGAGKTSVVSGVLNKHPDIVFSVSVTTRVPREGEKEGIDYYFISDEEFDRLIKRRDFSEWAVVYGYRYGTLKRTIQENMDEGRTILLDTDTVGAFNIKKHFPESVLIFIAPPSLESLRERLQNRNTERQDWINKRIEAVPQEMKLMPEYDYIVVNDKLSEAISQVEAIILAERHKSKRMIPSLTLWRKFSNGY